MSKKMLIDASHPEETRVVIVNGTRIDELDFESENKRQLRGNVYLARVTRVEPSLQAAFVEYGGNRHGFLAFSEIHPDYYQIPYEDRMALLEAEEAENKAEDDEPDVEDVETEDVDSDEAESSDDHTSDEDETVTVEDAGEDEDVAEEVATSSSSRSKRMSRRRYKIQEVIKRGQILLIQVVKEERGNKGAAMTTYLSMAGRYCVLMPNTPRGGGISRKIANGADRKRLKSIVSEFEVPQGMGVIVRTAGAKRTKIEIKRDYDYLSRLWETTRDTTLKSIAPALIHEEGNLVKRSIRDLYNKEIDEVLVQGDEAYKTAKSFIKMLMPSHAKNVKAYKDNIPLFLRYQVEKQLENSLDSVVQLKSGGYLVIHPTEALVSVDVNSGRSTKERNVERTALKTNLEAADEVARQMRLRDLAGLIVIDFIDMDENRNNRAVEKRMKDALAQDRARVQNSRITQFGLMEISRQRRRRSLLEGSTAHCEHCQGVGRKRTVESSALAAIRAIEEVGARGQARRIRVTVAPDVLLYLINDKRDLMNDIDARYQMFTVIVADDTLIRPQYTLDVLETGEAKVDDPLAAIEKEAREQDKKAESNSRRNARNKKQDDDADEDESEKQEKPESSDTDGEESGSSKRRRRRGRRGGRGRKPESEENTSEDNSSEKSEDTSATDDALNVIEPEGDTKPKRGRRRKSAKRDDAQTSDEGRDDNKSKRGRRNSANDASESETVTPDTEKSDDKPRSTTRRKAPSRKAKPEAETAQVAETKGPETKSDDTSESKSEAVEAKPADDKPKSTTRRKAPSRKKKAEPAQKTVEAVKDNTSSKGDAEPTEAEPTETAPVDDKPKSTTRRKAPARKKAPTSKAKAKPKSEPEAPAKESEAKPEVSEETEDTSKPVRSTARRKAPTRAKAPAKKPAAKKAPAKKEEPKKAETKKAPAKKAKPAKKEPEPAAKSPEAKSEDKAEEAPKAPRSTARRKAPSRAKPKADEAPKADEKTDEAVEESSRKAATNAPATKTEPKPEEKPAKRGWFRRLKKD